MNKFQTYKNTKVTIRSVKHYFLTETQQIHTQTLHANGNHLANRELSYLQKRLTAASTRKCLSAYELLNQFQ